MSTGAIVNLLHEWLGQCDAEALQIIDNMVHMRLQNPEL